MTLSSRFPLAFLLLTLLVGSSFAARPAQAQNLVSNPGFETGAFTDWTTTPAPIGSTFGVFFGSAHSGHFAAEFGASGGSDDTISQTITTIDGDNYTISFWLQSPSAGVGNEFHADFGGQTLLELQGAPEFGYRQYSFTTTAASASTALTFASRNPSSAFLLDDISVTDAGPAAVPEDSTTVSFGLLLALGLGSVLVAARKKRTV